VAGIERALQVGYASIEHLTGFVDGYEGGGFAFDPARLPVLAASIRAAGVWSCPTLTQMAFNMGYFTADSLAAWPETRDYHISPFSTPPADPVDSIRHWMALRRQVVEALHDAGAGLLLGTDAPAGHPLVGFSVHRELVELVAAGLTPYEALATGTRNVAEYFGTLDSTGTITVGKRADLVLLAGNPLQDIHHTAQPAGVMLNGRWLSRKMLDRQLARFKTLPLAWQGYR
jgi:hypothetical protein